MNYKHKSTWSSSPENYISTVNFASSIRNVLFQLNQPKIKSFPHSLILLPMGKGDVKKKTSNNVFKNKRIVLHKCRSCGFSNNNIACYQERF